MRPFENAGLPVTTVVNGHRSECRFLEWPNDILEIFLPVT